jgi:hypothetical protein
MNVSDDFSFAWQYKAHSAFFRNTKVNYEEMVNMQKKNNVVLFLFYLFFLEFQNNLNNSFDS